jgi:hypothetical protein
VNVIPSAHLFINSLDDTIVSSFLNKGITSGIQKEIIYAAREIRGHGAINTNVQQLSFYNL